MAESGDEQNEALRVALLNAIENGDTARQTKIRRDILQRSAALVAFQELREAKRREQDLHARLHPSKGGKTPALARDSREVEYLKNAERQEQDLDAILHPSTGGKTPAAMDEGYGEEYEGEESESARSEEGEESAESARSEEGEESAGSEEEEEEETETEETGDEQEGEESKYQLSVDLVLMQLATLRSKTVATALSATARQRAAASLIQYIMSPSFARDVAEKPRMELLAHVLTYEDAARAHVDELVTAQELAQEAEAQALRAFNASKNWEGDTLKVYGRVYWDLQHLRNSHRDDDAQ
jgi:hypothetical protein